MNCPACQRGQSCAASGILRAGNVVALVERAPRFRAYASSPLGVERDAQGRVWCQLFPVGTWHRSDFPGGKVELTAAFLAEFITSWRAGGSPPLPLDYDHKEDGPASGWIEDLRQAPTGELQGAVKWTDDAASEIKADKRRYLSPTWAMQHTNRRTGEKGGPWLYGAALLNDPFYDSMPRVAAGANAEPTHNPPHRSNTMNEEQLKTLRANLGLPADATIEAVLAFRPSPDVSEKLTASVKMTGDLESKLSASQAEVVTLRAAADASGKERFAEQVAAAIKEAKLEGRAVDALAGTKAFRAATDIETVRELLATVGKDVPLTTKGTPGTGAELTAADARKQYDTLIAAEQAKGLKYTDAARRVTAAHPNISSLVFATPASV